MGWLVGKHFFSHNNIIFFFFSLSVFPLVSGCTLYPYYSRFYKYSSPNSNFLPVPFLQYSSIPGIPDFLRQQVLYFLALRKLQLCLGLLYSTVQLTVYVLRRQHESALRFQDSRIHFVPWVLFPAYPRLLCCCDCWEIPTQYYTQQIFLHKNVAL